MLRPDTRFSMTSADHDCGGLLPLIMFALVAHMGESTGGTMLQYLKDSHSLSERTVLVGT